MQQCVLLDPAWLHSAPRLPAQQISTSYATQLVLRDYRSRRGYPGLRYEICYSQHMEIWKLLAKVRWFAHLFCSTRGQRLWLLKLEVPMGIAPMQILEAGCRCCLCSWQMLLHAWQQPFRQIVCPASLVWAILQCKKAGTFALPA